MNKIQKEVIYNAKHHTFNENGSIDLPLEINKLLGDTLILQNYTVTPKWGNAYIQGENNIVLTIPLNYNDSLPILQSRLTITRSIEDKYSKTIETLVYNKDCDINCFSGALVHSNIKGNFNKIYMFENGTCIEIVENKYAFLNNLSLPNTKSGSTDSRTNPYKKVENRSENAKQRMGWYPEKGNPQNTIVIDKIKK
jgi:hypothetical protein